MCVGCTVTLGGPVPFVRCPCSRLGRGWGVYRREVHLEGGDQTAQHINMYIQQFHSTAYSNSIKVENGAESAHAPEHRVGRGGGGL